MRKHFGFLGSNMYRARQAETFFYNFAHIAFDAFCLFERSTHLSFFGFFGKTASFVATQPTLGEKKLDRRPYLAYALSEPSAMAASRQNTAKTKSIMSPRGVCAVAGRPSRFASGAEARRSGGP
nr:hypothetical protein [Pandoravirus massiliensis]